MPRESLRESPELRERREELARMAAEIAKIEVPPDFVADPAGSASSKVLRLELMLILGGLSWHEGKLRQFAEPLPGYESVLLNAKATGLVVNEVKLASLCPRCHRRILNCACSRG
jgi:hypothetical protein